MRSLALVSLCLGWPLAVNTACTGGGGSLGESSSGASSSGSSSSGTSGSEGSSGGSGTSSSGTTATNLPPGSVCSTVREGGGISSNAIVCAANPKLEGCQACVRIPDRDAGIAGAKFCVFACRLGSNDDCATGQSCIARPDEGSNTPACTTGLGYCN